MISILHTVISLLLGFTIMAVVIVVGVLMIASSVIICAFADKFLRKEKL